MLRILIVLSIVGLLYGGGRAICRAQPFAEKRISLKWTNIGETHLLGVRLKLDGNVPRLFVVDTGAPNIYLARNVARALKLDVKTRVFDERTSVEFASGSVDFGVPGFVVPDVPFILMDMAATQEADRQVAGILGVDFLKNFALRIDFNLRRLDFVQPGNVKGTPSEPKDAVAIPLLYENGHYCVAAVLDGNATKFVIDTGAEDTLVRDPALLAALKPQATLDGETAAVAGGSAPSTEAVPVRGMRLSKLTVGGVTWDRPVVERRLDTPRHETNALGVDFLRRFNVLIDLPGKMLYLSPNPRYKEDEDRWIGAGLVPALSPDNRWLVSAVLSPSPAAEVGVAEGDEILTIFGKPAAGVSTAEMSLLLRDHAREGQAIVGTARRQADGTKYRFKLIVRKLL